MSKRKLIIASNLAIAIGGSALLGYGKYKDHEAGHERAGEIQALIDRFHGCPDRFGLTRECFSEQERTAMLNSAEEDRRAGRYEDAGMKFARLNMEFEANDMAAMCSPECRDRIRYEMEVRREATRRASEEIRARPAQSATPHVPSAQPPQPAQSADAQAEQTVTITFRTQPSGVEVLQGAEAVCTSSPECFTTLPAGNGPVTFTFRKQGYVDQTRSVVPSEGRQLDVTLEAQPPPPARAEPPPQVARPRPRPPRERPPQERPPPTKVQPPPQGGGVILSPD